MSFDTADATQTKTITFQFTTQKVVVATFIDNTAWVGCSNKVPGSQATDPNCLGKNSTVTIEVGSFHRFLLLASTLQGYMMTGMPADVSTAALVDSSSGTYSHMLLNPAGVLSHLQVTPPPIPIPPQNTVSLQTALSSACVNKEIDVSVVADPGLKAATGVTVITSCAKKVTITKLTSPTSEFSAFLCNVQPPTYCHSLHEDLELGTHTAVNSYII